MRYLLLSAHYRSPIEWSDERLAEIRRALDGFYRFFERYQRITGESFYSIDPPKSEKESMEVQQQYQEVQGDSMHRITNNAHLLFKECMNDDFNTGGAIGRLNYLLTDLNRYAEEKHLETSPVLRKDFGPRFKYGALVLRELAQMLGLFREPVAQADDKLVQGLMQLLIDLQPSAAGEALPQTADGLMQRLIALRAEARTARNFAMADQIRKRLGELGLTLEDRPGGTGWRQG